MTFVFDSFDKQFDLMHFNDVANIKNEKTVAKMLKKSYCIGFGLII